MAQRRSAYQENLNNLKMIVNEISTPNDSFCDLGCDDGSWSMELAKSINTKNVYGVEIIKERREIAISQGVNAIDSNLNETCAFNDNFFDIIHSNQVLEHLSNTDCFVSEIFRMLKPGGYAVISTENLASWHNIFALALGFMPFSLVNVTEKTAALGNRFAPHDNEEFWESSSWQHMRVFTTKGLIHLFTLFGFEISKILGAGYYPLGNWPARIDKHHCAFITFCVRKPFGSK